MTEREENKPKTLREFYDEGYRRVCLNCHTVFKPGMVREEWCEDGHYGYSMEMCRCGCDIVGYILEIDGKLYISDEPFLTNQSFPVSS